MMLTMIKDYGMVQIYCDPLDNLIFISMGDSQKYGGIATEIDVISKLNFPYNDEDLEETLLRSLELCHSKEPDEEKKQTYIERELGIRGYGKATKNLKIIILYWTKENGFQIEPHERIPRRGYVILEEQVIPLVKKIVSGQLAEAVKKAISVAKI